jgi:hypothetical protein
MKIAIVNGYFLEIAIDNKIVYNQPSVNDQMPLILNEYLPSIDEISQLFLYVSPGSLVGARSLISYCWAIKNPSMEIFYIDIIRDWYLKQWPSYKIVFPFTSKKFLVGYQEDHQYKHYFIESLTEISGDFWIDHSIKYLNIPWDEEKIIHWNCQNLFECNQEPNKFNLVEYKIW